MNSTIGGDGKNLIVVSADSHLKMRLVYGHFGQDDQHTNSALCDFITKELDSLGEESAQAQQLQVPITTARKFTSNACSDVLFIILDASTDNRSPPFAALGFIRFGRRQLYCSDGNELRHLPNCPAILDFYIRPKRCGYGKMLFDLLMEQLSLEPQRLAYDRPSPSMIAFLAKHYSLRSPSWQHNHYVIFDDIWR